MEKRLPTTTKVRAMIAGLKWLVPVLDRDLVDPPVSPVEGDRYLVASPATGDWVGKENNIAEWDGTAWVFTAPLLGMAVLATDEVNIFAFDGTDWIMPYGEVAGDMLKSVYDIDDSGIIDAAEKLKLGEDEVSVADAKDAVEKKHEHANKTILDAIEVAFTTALQTAYDNAADLAHGHANISILDSIEEALTTALKALYDKAHSSRALYDAGTDEIVFTDPDAYE